MKNEIVIFEDQNIKLEVNMKDENVWLNRNQIAKLFDRDIKTIDKHIKNALHEELDNSVVANFATTALDGKVYQVRHYNLDVIISVGYRVKSKNGIIFRRWANKILKDYLIKGYAINNKRLEYLEKTVKLIDIASRIDSDAKEVLEVINKYSKALDLLDNYDYNKIKKVEGTNSDLKISYEDCVTIINELKFNENSNLFAIERNKGLKSIIDNLYQTFNGIEVYSSLEEKAANFLYLLIKDHVFIDGNKRIAATLFIYFLFYYDILYKNNKLLIDNNTLTAITLLIAQSNPKEKEVMIDLVMNFLSIND